MLNVTGHENRYPSISWRVKQVRDFTASLESAQLVVVIDYLEPGEGRTDFPVPCRAENGGLSQFTKGDIIHFTRSGFFIHFNTVFGAKRM